MKKYIIIFIASFLVFLLIFGGVYYYISRTRLNDPNFDKTVEERPELMPPDPDKETVVNTLILGVNQGLSDIMIVARYNKQTNNIVLISIPRDTRVNIPGYGYDKINSANNRREGTALSMETVGNLLGIPIHHYVKIDLKGAEKIVDILGGVTVNVPMDMNYDDPAQGLSIHIKKGVQNLNGAEAVKFVRFRKGYADQDLGRIKAQQEFIRAFVKKLTSPSVIPKALDIIDAMSRNVKTNMTRGDIAKYTLKIGELSLSNIKMYTVPGEPKYDKGISYFWADEAKLAELMKQMEQELGPTDNDTAVAASGTTDKGTQQQGTQPSTAQSGEGKPAVKQPAQPDRHNIKVEIINATKKNGLAAKLKAELEAKGYQVIRIGSSQDLTYNVSRILNRSGSKETADLISKDTGINIVESDIDKSYGCDITIVLGKDRN